MRRYGVRLASAVGLALLVVAFASAARADDFTIASGDLHFDTGDPPYFTFNSNGPLASGVVLGGQWHGYPPGLAACGGNCPGGTTTTLSAAFGRPGALAFGTATVGGVTWDNAAGPDVWYSGTLQFDASTAVTLAAGATSYLSPFVFTGRLLGFRTSDLAGSPLFDVSLNGQGDAKLQVSFDPATDKYQFVAMSYTFKDTARTVTPEPASLLLLASGVAAAIGVRRARRHRAAGRTRS